MRPSSSLDKLPSAAFVISGRSDPRLLRATLRSIELLNERPALVLVITPKGREHLLDRLPSEESQVRARFMSSEGPEDAWLMTGLQLAAPSVDVVIFASEGTIFERGYLSRLKRRFTDWEDFVGSIEFVSSAIKHEAATDVDNLDAAKERREGRLHSLLRRRLRAYSLMSAVLAVRTEACHQLRFVSFSAFCDWLSYALFLERLRRRGRTVVQFNEHLTEMRFKEERRSGFDFGYTIYDRLSRIADYAGPNFSLHSSHLRPRREKMKLFGEQALQYILSPGRKKHVATIIQGMLTARRNHRSISRNVQNDVSALS